ncbi:MAG: ATP-dependent acyl-CoA ligase [Burkholderiales bacterium]|nr:MAG: ATP-dependent acyl-CoA ligase [Burkholderiales bacterium]
MITDLLARQAAERPDAPFVVTLEREHSYAEIYSAARRFATRLASEGVGQGDHVGLLAGNGAAFVVAWMGIGLRGAVAVTLNNQLIADGLRYSVDQCDARVLVVDRDWEDSRAGQLDARQAALPRLLIEGDAAWLQSLQALDEAEPAEVPASAPCTIMYTSGTTGLPKGVVNCHTAYLATGRATVKALRLTPADRVLVFLPLFHVNPQMYGVMSVLTAGAALLVLPRFSASSFFDDAIRLRATGCTFVGTVLSILVARHEGQRRDHGLRFFFGGGAPKAVWQAVEERFGIPVHEAYGMTEVGGWTTANTVDDHRFGSCGKPRPDLELRIVDADDRPVQPGQPGEIVVRPRDPDTILMGYYKKPEQMLESCRNLWFHSGDLGTLDEDGYMHYLGRMKELIRKSGEMISPVEIETALRRMHAVTDCAVVAVPDPVTGDEIKAVIVTQGDIDPAAVQAFLADKLARFMLPRYIEFAAAIPKTETEKIQRNKLQYLDARVHDLKLGRAVVAP